MQLERIDLGATNGTFVTKGEFKSNFLTTHIPKCPNLIIGQHHIEPNSDLIQFLQ